MMEKNDYSLLSSCAKKKQQQQQQIWMWKLKKNNQNKGVDDYMIVDQQ